MARTSGKRRRTASTSSSDSEAQVVHKKSKFRTSAVNRILDRAKKSSTSLSAAITEGNSGYRPAKQESPAGSSSSRKTSSKGKGRVQSVAEKFDFGRVFIFTDGLYVKHTRDGPQFNFGTKGSYQRHVPIPDHSKFDKAKYRGLAAECDFRTGPFSLNLSMEVDEVMGILEPLLPGLIDHLRSLPKVTNKYFREGVDSDYMRYLPPLIPLLRSNTRNLEISAGALMYPRSSFAQDLIHASADRSKGKTTISHQTIYLVTRSPISKSIVTGWNKPPPSTQPRVFSEPLQSTQPQAAHNQTPDEIVEFSSDDAEISDVSADEEGPASPPKDSREKQPSHQPSRQRLRPCRVLSVTITDSSDEGEGGCNTALNSPSQKTDAEEEENVSMMLQSMASVSGQTTPPPPVMNDPMVLLDVFNDTVPSFSF